MHRGISAEFNAASTGPLVQSSLSHLETFFLLHDRPLHQLDCAVRLAYLVVRLYEHTQSVADLGDEATGERPSAPFPLPSLPSFPLPLPPVPSLSIPFPPFSDGGKGEGAREGGSTERHIAGSGI